MGAILNSFPADIWQHISGSLRTVRVISAMWILTVIALIFVSLSEVRNSASYFYSTYCTCLSSQTKPHLAEAVLSLLPCGCMWRCLHSLSSGFIKPITRRNRRLWNLSHYGIYNYSVEGGQSSLWCLLEEQTSRSGALVLLVCDSSLQGLWGGALTAVWRLRGWGEVGERLNVCLLLFPS